ncbi:alpha/beta fold hydrolase [Actinacidiphila acidipaludis]|uniref:Alpha/beta hydrolase n=1 Tax=Actinacidiphila acidipaludis TaxID=2873382 RepID=A0ABS7PZ10_9ACTN|nr:alpha/beta hydrolase [Streptomyces acidipaludis]MBY8876131.1 alpha/beta hydrolase [Streptomyces acidipaludis]
MHIHAHRQTTTVVLVHGAFADSSSWNGVIKKLKHEGFPVVAVANPLRGLSGDAAYVRDVLAGIDGPVVLVGHSYGGAVISDAARDSDKVKALVYVAAFLPERGESANELAVKFPGSSLGEALRPVPITLPDGSQDVDLSIDPSRYHHQFAADVPAHVADIMAVTQRPATAGALGEAASEPAWRTIPSWSVVATEDLNIPRELQIFMADRAQAQVREVAASHAVSVSHPETVARVIEEAAGAVG